MASFSWYHHQGKFTRWEESMDCSSKTSASGRLFYWNHKQYCISYTIVCREGGRKGWWKTINVCVWGLGGTLLVHYTMNLDTLSKYSKVYIFNLWIQGRIVTASMMLMDINDINSEPVWCHEFCLIKDEIVGLSSAYLTSRCNTKRQRSAMSWKPLDRSFKVWRICSLLLSVSPITWLSAEHRDTPKLIQQKAGRFYHRGQKC